MAYESITADGLPCGVMIRTLDGQHALRCLLDVNHHWPVHVGEWIRHPDFNDVIVNDAIKDAEMTHAG